MTPSSLMASMFNLVGPDLIIIAVILIFLVAFVGGGIALLVYVFGRSRKAAPPPLPPDASVDARLRELEQLKQKNLISEAEYEEQRRRIISGV
jgi:hypothetical protein